MLDNLLSERRAVRLNAEQQLDNLIESFPNQFAKAMISLIYDFSNKQQAFSACTYLRLIPMRLNSRKTQNKEMAADLLKTIKETTFDLFDHCDEHLFLFHCINELFAVLGSIAIRLNYTPFMDVINKMEYEANEGDFLHRKGALDSLYQLAILAGPFINKFESKLKKILEIDLAHSQPVQIRMYALRCLRPLLANSLDNYSVLQMFRSSNMQIHQLFIDLIESQDELSMKRTMKVLKTIVEVDEHFFGDYTSNACKTIYSIGTMKQFSTSTRCAALDVLVSWFEKGPEELIKVPNLETGMFNAFADLVMDIEETGEWWEYISTGEKGDSPQKNGMAFITRLGRVSAENGEIFALIPSVLPLISSFLHSKQWKQRVTGFCIISALLECYMGSLEHSDSADLVDEEFLLKSIKNEVKSTVRAIKQKVEMEMIPSSTQGNASASKLAKSKAGSLSVAVTALECLAKEIQVEGRSFVLRNKEKLFQLLLDCLCAERVIGEDDTANDDEDITDEDFSDEEEDQRENENMKHRKEDSERKNGEKEEDTNSSIQERLHAIQEALPPPLVGSVLLCITRMFEVLEGAEVGSWWIRFSRAIETIARREGQYEPFGDFCENISDSKQNSARSSSYLSISPSSDAYSFVDLSWDHSCEMPHLMAIVSHHMIFAVSLTALSAIYVSLKDADSKSEAAKLAEFGINTLLHYKSTEAVKKECLEMQPNEIYSQNELNKQTVSVGIDYQNETEANNKKEKTELPTESDDEAQKDEAIELKFEQDAGMETFDGVQNSEDFTTHLIRMQIYRECCLINFISSLLFPFKKLPSEEVPTVDRQNGDETQTEQQTSLQSSSPSSVIQHAGSKADSDSPALLPILKATECFISSCPETLLKTSMAQYTSSNEKAPVKNDNAATGNKPNFVPQISSSPQSTPPLSPCSTTTSHASMPSVQSLNIIAILPQDRANILCFFSEIPSFERFLDFLITIVSFPSLTAQPQTGLFFLSPTTRHIVACQDAWRMLFYVLSGRYFSSILPSIFSSLINSLATRPTIRSALELTAQMAQNSSGPLTSPISQHQTTSSTSIDDVNKRKLSEPSQSIAAAEEEKSPRLNSDDNSKSSSNIASKASKQNSNKWNINQARSHVNEKLNRIDIDGKAIEVDKQVLWMTLYSIRLLTSYLSQILIEQLPMDSIIAPFIPQFAHVIMPYTTPSASHPIRMSALLCASQLFYTIRTLFAAAKKKQAMNAADSSTAPPHSLAAAQHQSSSSLHGASETPTALPHPERDHHSTTNMLPPLAPSQMQSISLPPIGDNAVITADGSSLSRSPSISTVDSATSSSPSQHNSRVPYTANAMHSVRSASQSPKRQSIGTQQGALPSSNITQPATSSTLPTASLTSNNSFSSSSSVPSGSTHSPSASTPHSPSAPAITPTARANSTSARFSDSSSISIDTPFPVIQQKLHNICVHMISASIRHLDSETNIDVIAPGFLGLSISICKLTDIVFPLSESLLKRITTLLEKVLNRIQIRPYSSSSSSYANTRIEFGKIFTEPQISFSSIPLCALHSNSASSITLSQTRLSLTNLLRRTNEHECSASSITETNTQTAIISSLISPKATTSSLIATELLKDGTVQMIGHIVASIAARIGAQFLPHFQSLSRPFSSLLLPSSSEYDKAVALFVFSSVIRYCGVDAQPLVSGISPAAVSLLRSCDTNVQLHAASTVALFAHVAQNFFAPFAESAAVVLAQKIGEFRQKYVKDHEMNQKSDLLSEEIEKQSVDIDDYSVMTACAIALGRIIMFHGDKLSPLVNVLSKQVWFEALPLTEGGMEADIQHSYLTELVANGDEVILGHYQIDEANSARDSVEQEGVSDSQKGSEQVDIASFSSLCKKNISHLLFVLSCIDENSDSSSTTVPISSESRTPLPFLPSAPLDPSSDLTAILQSRHENVVKCLRIARQIIGDEWMCGAIDMVNDEECQKWIERVYAPIMREEEEKERLLLNEPEIGEDE
ncbi:uncharacterized protein MONOS_393 [Monocercomonoides exilis]|uniref:uncharacterized protein n=1 Tax=Monocercomonoides exilis TaxID=2049356 RepID=UPI0035599E2B|nr:hypothetical protein MONOS_393 [Monocercomonoides exilis]|eukprot:MONOS_393.1-p1 / transcript=MONOS_393.1 / gene=MONOS_393 / organism=Monocercomonoides_exilis_PA203 / gene_product=unspecified product / transcript_product=unspecified product / location=Mono_scaffold00006:203370-210109(-) / protein_length=1987 / sequence_SO=supercontig / SO=protein_coding / is_pseudo=false